VRIEVGQNMVFRPDGRVQHVECEPVVCAEMLEARFGDRGWPLGWLGPFVGLRGQA